MSPCPPERAWDELATGIAHGKEAEALVEHASMCLPCAVLLREAIEVFAPIEEPTPISVGRSWKQLSYFAAAVFILAIVGGRAIYPRWQNYRDEQLVIAAYRRARPSDFAFAGVPFGPLRRERGVSPMEMLAEPKRDDALAALVALREWDTGRAKSILAKARAAGDSSEGVMNNLAVAIAMEADAEKSPSRYEEALRAVDELVQRHPAFAAAYFNRAVILLRLGRKDESSAAINRFLQLEQDPAWRAEAESVMGQR